MLKRYAVPYLPTLVAILGIWLVRQGWLLYLADLRGPLGLFAIPLVGCAFLIVVMIGGIVLTALLSWTMERTDSLLPKLLFISSIFIAFFLPLFPAADTPEKLHFFEHRADFEAVVEIARGDQLEADEPNCPAGFRPPLPLRHVSQSRCMHI